MINDLRYTFRTLWKDPGFAAIAVLTLALGVSANTTIFTYINSLLFRPPAGVEAPGKLMAVWNRLPNGDYLQQCYPDYAYYRDHNRVFSGLLAYSSDPTRVSWSRPGQNEIINGQVVSGNFFSVLGVTPGLGRAFLPEEDLTPEKNPVVVLRNAFWRERLGSDPSVVGRTLTLNGYSFTVVGVAPEGFTGAETGLVPDFWAPMMMQRQIIPSMDMLANQTGYWIFAVGRLKPGVTASQAQADLDVLAKQLALANPKSNKGWSAAVLPATGIPPEFRSFVVPFTALLMAVVGLVLLIACANAANLVLARAAGRAREMAIRSALGAGRRRLIRQVLTESIVLACLAGGVGLLFVAWAAPLLLSLKPAMLSFITLDLSLDWRVLGFTLLVSLLTGVICGLAPALRSSKLDVITGLKDGSGGGFRRSRLRSILVTTQIAVCLILLIGSGLCLQSLFNAHSIDPGFKVENRLGISFDLQILGYSNTRGERFYLELLDRVQNVPGVASTSLVKPMPLGFSRQTIGVAIEGHQPPPGQSAYPIGAAAVGPGYFQTLGIPVLRGREFGLQDKANGTPVVIINEAMAQRFWPGKDPIGRRLSLDFGKPQSCEIVGVVKTGKYRSLREDGQAFMYMPFFQSYRPSAVLLVHTAGAAKQVLAAVRRQIEELDPNMPLLHTETLEEYMAIPLFPARVTGILLSAFGALALLLALVGLYGAVSYSVSQRTREFGVRLALGAQRADLIRLMLREGLAMTVIGLGIGLVGALALTRVLSSLLYGIQATDALTFAGVSLLLAAVTLIANFVPARRATRVDPVVALRYE